MNKTNDEVYITLLKAKQEIADYTKNKVKNKNWQPYYNGIVEDIDNIIVDYAITTKMSSEEIIDCLLEVGADNKDSIYYNDYNTLKEEIKNY